MNPDRMNFGCNIDPLLYQNYMDYATMNPMMEMEINMRFLMHQNMMLREQLKKQNQVQVEQTQPVQKVAAYTLKIQNSESSSSQFENPKIKEKRNNSSNMEFKWKKSNKIKKYVGQRYETKNIAKNYGKAILSFVECNKELVKRMVSKFPNVSFNSFVLYLKSKRRRINSIADLRSFWLEAQHQDYPKLVRILSNVFLRFYSLQHIFNSKICNYSCHVKYRARLIQALRNPTGFTCIKLY